METVEKYNNTTSTLYQKNTWIEKNINAEVNHEFNPSQKKLFLDKHFIEKKLIEAEKSGFTNLSAESILVEIKEELRQHGDL